MSITTGNATSAARAHVSRPRRLHHAAWVTRDQEATRHFYEDIIGLPLEAAWAERGPTGREYYHTFFTLGDGGALAFFQYVAQDEQAVELRSPGHIAFECDTDTQHGIKERLEPMAMICASATMATVSRSMSPTPTTCGWSSRLIIRRSSGSTPSRQQRRTTR